MHPDYPWSRYLRQHLKHAHISGKPWLEQLADHYYGEWQAIEKATALPKTVVHDDLHMENMLFENDRLVGVLDFSELTVGTAAQELRQLYRLGEDVVQRAIDAYQQRAGITIPLPEVKAWAIVTELAPYCAHVAKGEMDHPSKIRTAANLQSWLPEYRDKL